MDDPFLTFHVAAEEELRDAVLYYESRSRGLGATFLHAVETAVAQICEHPAAAPQVTAMVRRKQVHRFPYAVMYSVHMETITILAVANQRRRPLYWLGQR